MILTLVLALQSATGSPTSITVRDGDRTVSVPIVFTKSGSMVRADQIASPLGGVVRKIADDRYTVSVAGALLELTRDAPFVRVGRQVFPIPTAPAMRGVELYLPLALVTDVLPRVATGLMYDASVGELRRFVPRVSARTPAADSARASDPLLVVGPSRAPPVAVPNKPRAVRRHIVVVDAGHGGPDRGMSGPIGSREKIHEADVTLQVARRVREELRARGIDVVMTRLTDTLIALSDRGKIANRAKGDLFLSIHVNAANPRWRDPGAARGFETYFLAEARTEDAKRVEEMENEAVKYEADSGNNAGDPLSFILTDMKQNEHLRESSELAVVVQRALGRVHPGADRGVKQAGFRVLVTAYMPAVLVEIGFGSNPAEARFIAGTDGQQVLARSIAEATVAYLARYDRRSATGSAP